MAQISLDMYQTLGIAVVVLLIGAWLKKKIRALDKFCVPAPVVGGLLYAGIMYVLYLYNVVEFQYDDTLKNVCMVLFFTSVGFQANIKVLKKGGVGLVIFLVVVVGMIFAQNGLAILVAKLIGMDPALGLCTGSIPMVGGHGTSGAFGPILEDFGVSGATTLCTASATFGLVAGSLMGGPLGKHLIEKKNLLAKVKEQDPSVLMEEKKKHSHEASMYAAATYQLAIAVGLGTIISWLLSKTGMTFPVYIGSMIIAAIMRNVGEASKKITIHMGEINDIGGICLSIFLGIAMITLKLWQLANLALPMLILLAVQLALMFIIARFVVFNVMGRDYDAAVLAAGTCGFGMGATPNAMANMQAVSEKYVPSVKAYILVPIVGSMFADFLNSLIITLFINLIK
ncbi:MAG: sodium/glutamate symporter [Lachnospiraceae bacterium]|nr:sodium/glutamate symporter [Lachnospiraceae bacterium]